MKKACLNILFIIVLFAACSKKSSPDPTPPTPPAPPETFTLKSVSTSGLSGLLFTNIAGKPPIRLEFSNVVDRNTVSAISFTSAAGTPVGNTISYEKSDSTVVITPETDLTPLTAFTLVIPASIASKKGTLLGTSTTVNIRSALDSSNKFAVIADNELLDKVQRTTFKYFWDFGHPTSGLARERSNGDNNLVTTGGSGFGIMAIIAAADRNFIAKADALSRLKLIVDFLKDKAQKFHGAFPHWLDGTTGTVIPFSNKDDGADLVETSFLMEGLLCARQYFNGASSAEVTLRADINTIWRNVEWDWFRQNNEDALYWHWSPANNFDINVKISGWNEALITYVLAAASPTHSVPKSVYDNGWARNGAMKNGKSFYNLTLPLGPDYGGPLFFAHYSFMGINPTGLSDAYADYWMQNKNHALINYNYCVRDQKGYGYSGKNWGLTASDIMNGYTASSPTNDVGVIAPTAAIASMPYTPAESMQALKFFYYTLGDKIWKEDQYGFVDAFSLKDLWFANSYLAIDQGPIIVMLENYRSGLLWKLFMSCPEIKTGMRFLGFSSPNL